MIEGVVSADYEPVITLTLRGPSGRARDIDAVVDTGYNGFLTLPTTLVEELGLPYVSMAWATLADGSEISYDVHGVTVLWDGQTRYIEADEANATPLVGMLLLDGHDLHVAVEPGGRVLIHTLA